MKTVKISWNSYQIPTELVPELCKILLQGTDAEGKAINFSIESGIDVERGKLLEELKKEIGAEIEQYKKYWLDTVGERDKLKKRVKELEEDHEAH